MCQINGPGEAKDSRQDETGCQPAGPGAVNNGNFVLGWKLNAGEVRPPRSKPLLGENFQSCAASIQCPGHACQKETGTKVDDARDLLGSSINIFQVQLI